MEALIVYCTVPDAQTGKRIATVIVEEKLCACVNQLPAVTSYYIYDGKFNEDSEELLIIKTTRSKFEALQKRIEGLHPYDVPEIIATEIAEGNPAYLEWLNNAVR